LWTRTRSEELVDVDGGIELGELGEELQREV
jgi:hypothetical protein